MQAVRERIKNKGMVQIPREIMQKLRLSEGDVDNPWKLNIVFMEYLALGWYSVKGYS